MNEPLTKKDYQEINKGLAACNEMRLEIDRARQAGADVEEAELRLNHVYDRLVKLKEVYFPNQP